MTDQDEPGYGLVMPFIACETQGGAYEDVAFVAGYAGGHLDAELGLLRAGERELYAPPALVAQLDLIAMRHGWVLTATPHDEEWTLCHFRRAPDPTLGDRICHECGARNPCWYADSDWWNEVVSQDREVVLCPTCFLVRAETARSVVHITRPPMEDRHV